MGGIFDGRRSRPLDTFATPHLLAVASHVKCVEPSVQTCHLVVAREADAFARRVLVVQ